MVIRFISIITKYFQSALLRSIYYNLKKGAALGEFEVVEIKTEKGDFSWERLQKRHITSLEKMQTPG